MINKKLTFIFFLIIIANQVFAQLSPAKYWVMFSDKNNSPYSINKPSEFLSPKAIERRAKQGITIKENDLPINPWYLDSIRNIGVRLINWSKWFNFATIETNDAIALNKISNLPFVSNVDKVAIVGGKQQYRKKVRPRIIDTALPTLINNGSQNSNYTADIINIFNRKASSNYDYGFAENQTTMIACDYLHDLGFRGDGITIAVLDAGFWNVDTMSIFDSLWANNQILGTRDFVNPGNNVFKESTHGMMVLSIMGGNIPGKLIGTAPKANYWLLRSEDGATEYVIEEGNWAVAAEFADSVGVDIINSSLGYTTFYDTIQDHKRSDLDGNTALVTRAADLAASKGILVVNSAGNSGNEPWLYIGTPADADSILAIGAVDAYGNYAPFSSVGPTYDGRVKPDVSAQGLGTWVAAMSGGNNVSAGNGTSFSGPVIAGAVACLWQSHISLNNMNIIQAVKESASQYNNPDSLLGYGIPNLAAAYLLLSKKKIYDIDKDKDINVFPNPFIDKVYIVFSSSDTNTISIELFDMAGKRVRNPEKIHRATGYNYFSINDLNNLSEGIYLLNINSGNKNFSKKIFKTKN